MAEWIQLIFGTEDILGLSYTTLQGNLTTFKIRVLPSRILSQTVNIAEFYAFFHHSMSIITNVVCSSTTASLLHQTPTIFYNTLAVMQSMTQFVCNIGDFFI